MAPITRVLTAIEQGDPQAAGQLLPLVYAELRKLARRRMAGAASGRSFQGTDLVHEAYLRLAGAKNAHHWELDGLKAELVRLRYFAGLSMEQAAEVLGISLATAHRYWNCARARLHQRIFGDRGRPEIQRSEHRSNGQRTRPRSCTRIPG